MSSNDQLWGTFAVDDHLRERAFVAEVILFDRLIIPQPPCDDDEKDQHLEWTKAGWEPKLLKQTIDTLGELAIPVSWNKDLRDKWRGEFAGSPAERAEMRMRRAHWASEDVKAIANAPADLPSRHVTRMVVAQQVSSALAEQRDDELYRKIRDLDIDPTAEIETVVGYGSYAKFHQEVPVDERQPPVSTDQDAAFLFGWDFIVPDDSNLTDTQLLDIAVKLSGKSEFRDSRRQFHDWRRKLIAKKVSTEVARAEMDRCLKVYNDVVAKNQRSTRTLTALQVMSVTAPAADLLLPGLGIAGGVVFGLGALLWEKHAPRQAVGEREKIAALVHDSRKAFGWREH